MSRRGRSPVASARAPSGGPVCVLVSACLLGERVRYDGGHKRDPFVVKTLGRFVGFVPVCPEVECGLPIPREAMRLSGGRAAPRLVTIGTGLDHTERMARFAEARLGRLAPRGLCGYVCKSGSPSCAMGAGLFTKAFRRRFPLVPVEEEGRLRDPVLREMFVERVFTVSRFLDAARRGRSRAALLSFHADHELLLRAHGRAACAAMGRLLARAKELPTAALFARYEGLLAKALALRPTAAKRAEALVRMAGRLRRKLSDAATRELLEAIARYRAGLAPFAAPMTLVRRHARLSGDGFLARQAFLDPYPAQLALPQAGREVRP